MRYFEISGGFRIPISEEEQELLNAAKEEIAEDELTERALEVAAKMTSRGLLVRETKNGKSFYIQNSLPDIGRF